jgi:hypothetical protein
MRKLIGSAALVLSIALCAEGAPLHWQPSPVDLNIGGGAAYCKQYYPDQETCFPMINVIGSMVGIYQEYLPFHELGNAEATAAVSEGFIMDKFYFIISDREKSLTKNPDEKVFYDGPVKNKEGIICMNTALGKVCRPWI